MPIMFYFLMLGDGDGISACWGYRENSLSSGENSNRKNRRIRDICPDLDPPDERPAATHSPNQTSTQKLKGYSQLCESSQITFNILDMHVKSTL